MNKTVHSPLQNFLLIMYNDIFEECNKNNIKLMLGGGTLLGAIRHEGFIPWDDDLDLMIFREDVDKFIAVIEGMSKKGFSLQGFNSDENSLFKFYKVRKKGTVYIEKETEHYPMDKEISIDIFVIESIPDNYFRRLIHGIKCNILSVIASTSAIYTYQRDSIKPESIKETFVHWVRLIVFRLFSYKTPNDWMKRCEHVFSKYKNHETQICSIPSGRKYYFGELEPKSTFFPVVEGKFGHYKAYFPSNYLKYLRKNYGDRFMDIPPESKRTNHNLIEVFLGNEEI